MLDFIKEMYNDLTTYKSYVTESLEPIFKSKNQMPANQTLNIVTESDDPKTQCFEDFKKYSKDNSHIHPLDHVKTHTGKKNTYLLFATADSVNGSYKPLIEGLKKNVKYKGNDADWHSIYLPGDVFLAIKVGKEMTENEITPGDDEKYLNEYTKIFNDLVYVLTEDSPYDGMHAAFGPQFTKDYRLNHIYNYQFQKGKMTKDQYNSKYNNLQTVKNGVNLNDPKFKNNYDNRYINYNRPNQNKPTKLINHNGSYDIKNGGTHKGAINSSDGEKFKHYLNILSSTMNYNEYKTAFKNIESLIGVHNIYTITIDMKKPYENNPRYEYFANKKSAGCTPQTKLYHTSKIKGITRLSGKFRGNDGVFFSSKRVYFHQNFPGRRNTRTATADYYVKPGEYVYEYVGDPTKAFIDPELRGSAVFIETDTSIPVKDVTDEFTKEKAIERKKIDLEKKAQKLKELKQKHAMHERQKEMTNIQNNKNTINIHEYVDDILLEAATDTHIMMENLYPKVSDILSTPVGDRKFKQMVGAFMDRNSMKLHTAGPTYLVPFADRDKAEFFNLFKLDQKYVKKLIKDVTDKIGSGSQFKLLSDNPIYWVFYCCIRYYTMKKDTKGLNTALSIYALSNYPSVFHMSFPYPPNAAVMQYTMDNLSEKYIMKQAGHVFGGLFLSIQHSYEFLKPYMADASDKEIIRFIQRIRNDQKSMMKNICDQYMKNHAAGRRVKLNLDSHEGIQIDDDNENNTTVVQTVADNVVNRLITSGLDLRRVSQCKDIAQIGMADCRFYLSKIVTDKYVKEITAFIYSVLFLYLYDEKKTKQDINSTYFLKWSAELFRKTNSNNPNIRNIKETLDKWGEETGVHAKFKREASRVNYKKAIFWYFILSIQYYNK